MNWIQSGSFSSFRKNYQLIQNPNLTLPIHNQTFVWIDKEVISKNKEKNSVKIMQRIRPTKPWSELDIPSALAEIVLLLQQA